MRIELRKVETLPGGGLQNTFFDFVGPSPINLWQSGDDYGNLTTVRPLHRISQDGSSCCHAMQQDFPFSIRIPESIPPTITLEKGGKSCCYTSDMLLRTKRPIAGIKYELIATVCVKEKK